VQAYAVASVAARAVRQEEVPGCPEAMDDWDAEFAAAARANAAQEKEHALNLKASAVARKTSRIETRRARSEAALSDILPARLQPGTSYHVLSSGDVDALSFIAHLARAHRLDDLLISTFCLSLPDLEWLAQQQTCGRIGHIRIYCGEILRNTYPDVYDRLCSMERAGQADLTIARNHAKITLAAAGSARYTVESSANMNTNPRIEQSAVHSDPALYAFYADFFAGIKCIDKKNRCQTP